MQIKSKYSWIKHADFMLVDLLSLFFAFVISFYIKFRDLSFVQSDDWMRYLLLVLALSIIINFLSNPYSGILRRSYYVEIIKAFQLSIYNLLITTFIFFAFKIGAIYSREMSFYMYGFYFGFSVVFKFIWKKLIVSGIIVVKTTKQISLFVIADQHDLDQTLHNICAGDFQLYDIKGIHIVDQRDEIGYYNNIPVIASSYEQYVLDNNIEEVLISVNSTKINSSILEKFYINGIGVNITVDSAIGFQPEEQSIQNFGVFKALSFGYFSFSPRQMIYLIVKRLMDIICGIIGVVVLIPITIVIKAVNIISGDYASIFYRQERVGLNGKLINIWKFRSMVPNAEELLQELLKNEQYRKEWEENQKFEHDPRITKIGNFIRKTSIDELPQLLNVLIGDMSLVGPRPLVKGELEAHDGLKLYQRVKPGITGWWGCNGRSNIDYRERLELEYYYVKNCSLYLDILCIFRTVVAVIKKRGAQ